MFLLQLIINNIGINKQMTTVPKLNYANIRGKSKSKDSENSQRKLQSGSDLFSHMNQDNLKYIQSQIKQKNKKNSQLSLIRKPQQEDMALNNVEYPQKAQDKNVGFSQIQNEREPQPNYLFSRQKQSNIIKTDTESIKFNLMMAEQLAPKQKVSQQTQTNKLSYYDLISQAKSKRVPSLQGCLEEEQVRATNKDLNGKFINFLSNYIDDLNNKGIKNIKKRKNKSRNEQTNSSESEKQILKNGVYEQKKKNEMLSKQIQKSRMNQQQYKKRFDNLEQLVKRLSQQVKIVKQQLHLEKMHKKSIQQMSVIQNAHPIQTAHHTRYSVFENYPLRPDGLRNQYSSNSNYIYSSNYNRASQKNKTASLSRPFNDKVLEGKPQAMEQKLQQITALQRELELFSETGILQIKQKQNYNFDHFLGHNELQ